MPFGVSFDSVSGCVPLAASTHSGLSLELFLWLTGPCNRGQSFSSCMKEQVPLSHLWWINQKNLAVRFILMAVASFPFYDFLAFSICLRLNLKVNFVPHCSLWQWANEIKLNGGIACILHTKYWYMRNGNDKGGWSWLAFYRNWASAEEFFREAPWRRFAGILAIFT